MPRSKPFWYCCRAAASRGSFRLYRRCRCGAKSCHRYAAEKMRHHRQPSQPFSDCYQAFASRGNYHRCRQRRYAATSARRNAIDKPNFRMIRWRMFSDCYRSSASPGSYHPYKPRRYAAKLVRLFDQQKVFAKIAVAPVQPECLRVMLPKSMRQIKNSPRRQCRCNRHILDSHRHRYSFRRRGSRAN